jgi:hypothetical protein
MIHCSARLVSLLIGFPFECPFVGYCTLHMNPTVDLSAFTCKTPTGHLRVQQCLHCLTLAPHRLNLKFPMALPFGQNLEKEYVEGHGVPGPHLKQGA